jgi:hypothetical protein
MIPFPGDSNSFLTRQAHTCQGRSMIVIHHNSDDTSVTDQDRTIWEGATFPAEQNRDVNMSVRQIAACDII